MIDNHKKVQNIPKKDSSLKQDIIYVRLPL